MRLLAPLLAAVVVAALAWPSGDAAAADLRTKRWTSEWPRTDFSRHSVDFDEILSGGPPKDGIPSIDDPEFVAVAEASDLAPNEPVIGLVVNGDARAYPLRILIWHEIVNDTVGGVPVLVTYCPLCNAAIAFERSLDGEPVAFGTTGKLRHSDLVMYDRTTESWWQQFTGEAIVGALTGRRLELVPARLESFARFAERVPGGRVLVPNDPSLRPYGRNPYVGYDSAAQPFLYRGDLPEGVPPMARVVVLGQEGWTLELLRRKGRIESGDHVLTWSPGQASALDDAEVAKGADVGNVVVQKKRGGALVDVPYDLTFAFVFYAFEPSAVLHGVGGPIRWSRG